ncbi:MAG: hypothetical protein ACM3N6_14905 [Betaproteobacteria bacterium]
MANHTSWFAGLNTADPETAAAAQWEATRAQTMLATQVMAPDAADATRRDIGRSVGNDEHELFVSCAPGEALLQQLEVLKPDYIAVHDIGCSISRRLLEGVAAASQRRMHRLVIRRQGYGTDLATLQFIEWSTPGSATIRLYTTEVDADTASRQAIAMTLLAHSRLAVVFVGDLPPHVLASALQPLRDALLRGKWPNRQLLMLPLSSTSALASHSAQLGGGGVSVRTTPQVTRPAEAWAFLSGAWNRLREQQGAGAAHLPVLAGVASPTTAKAAARSPRPAPPRLEQVVPPVTPELPLRPMPEVPGPGPREARPEERLHDYLGRVMKIAAVQRCCVFDCVNHRVLAQAARDDTGPEVDRLRRQSEVLLDAAARCADALDLQVGVPELLLTLDAQHLLLRAVPGQRQQVLAALFDKTDANLMLARLQLQRLDDEMAADAA